MGERQNMYEGDGGGALARMMTQEVALARAVVETIHEPLLALDYELRVVYANAAFQEALPLRDTELIGQPIDELDVDHSAISQLRDQLAKMRQQVEERVSFDLTVHLKGPAGHGQHVNVRGFEEHGLILLAFEDVTAPDRAELEQAEQRFEREHVRAQTYLDVAGVMIVVLDASGCIELINRAGAETLQRRPADLTGQDWFEAVLPERVRERSRAIFRDLIEGRLDGLANYENVVLTGSGAERRILWKTTTMRNEAGEVTGVVGSGLDITDRKQAQQELKVNQEQLRAFFDQAQDAFLIANDGGEIVDCNPAACEMLGYARDELIGEPIEQISAGSSAYGERWGSFLRSGSARGEYQLETKQGAVIHVEYRATADLLPGLHLSVLRNVTGRKRREEELRESEQRFRSLFEAAPDAIFVIDGSGHVLDLNPAACEMHREVRESLVGQEIRALVRDLQAGEADEDFERLIDGELAYLQLCKWVVNEHAIPVEVRSNRFVYDGQAAVLLQVRDISERLATEEALEQSRLRAHAILETTQDAVVTITGEGRIEAVNPATEVLFGYEPHELVGRNVDLLIPEDKREYLGQHLEMEGGELDGLQREITVRRKDGSTFPADLAVSEVQLDTQWMLTAFIRDISDRRRLEQEVLRISEEERQRVGRDIHDGLASYFSGIAMLGRGLVNQQRNVEREQPGLAETLEEIVRLARRGAEQSRAIARGLSPVSLDKEGLPAALVELARTAETLSGWPVQVDLDEELPRLQDRFANQLFRIAQEAVHNAIRHAEATRLRVRLRRMDERLVLVVQDDGRGLPAEEEGGKGMGLHIMPYRARLLGATLGIDSNPGSGTKITCTMPMRTAVHTGSQDAGEER